MAININDGFHVQSKVFVDNRQSFDTLEEMKNYNTNLIPDGYETYVKATDKKYKFLSTNTIDNDLGQWREIENDSSLQFEDLVGTIDNPCILSTLSNGFYIFPTNVYYKETSNVDVTKISSNKGMLLVNTDSINNVITLTNIMSNVIELLIIDSTNESLTSYEWKRYITNEELENFVVVLTKAEYETLESGNQIDNNKLYIITDYSVDTTTTIEVKSNLTELNDVILTNLKDKQILRYDKKTNTFVNDNLKECLCEWKTIVKDNVKINDTITINVPIEKAIFNIFKYATGTTGDTIDIIKSFENSNSDDFYCNSDELTFNNEGIELKEEFEINISQNENVYESEDIKDFIDLNKIEIIE